MATFSQAEKILRAFGFTDKQSNIMSQRTLLSLCGLTLDEGSTWNLATNERMGVRGIMDWIREYLNFQVAENTRETIRRQVLKQFTEVGFTLHNDDDPKRPPNSSKNCYKLSDTALEVIKTYGTPAWDRAITRYRNNFQTQVELYRAARRKGSFDVVFPSGMEIRLKAGGQNTLIAAMIEKFCPSFIDGGKILYVGDAGDKYLVYDTQTLTQLGIELDRHGKMPDLVVLDEKRNWLFPMEAASTHGPVDHSRYLELHELFGSSSAGLVLVSCFPDKKTLRRFIADLAWETEVWVADEPTHMMHLNGSRFLGPYANQSIDQSDRRKSN